ncbi:diguanylate cyclase [Alteromonas gilva]|uniref:Diguanylate cyclase n=1 Tax=Alteromonas gilva TaxID=2987522 RepID=A0ABT5L353_9ALTE|nr:diguanylate cyclase [Alteromonas gilva]MDC8831464.1 diguanylate cyclase [Alteromonas gilva]
MTTESIFASTFEYCGVGLAHVRTDGAFIRVNKTLSDFLGYSPAELVALDFQQITHPDHLDKDLIHVADVLDGIYDSYQMEKLYIHKQGHLVWGNLTVTLVRNADNSPAFFISVVEDIDEKKRIEQNYFAAQETLRSIISSLSDRMAVWVATPDLSSLIFVNEGYQRIWGRSGKELYDNPCSFIDHIHVADRQRVLSFYRQRITAPWQFEYRVMRDDGELRYIRERGEVIHDHCGEIISLVITADDITHDKQLNEALKSANHKLASLSRIDALTGIDNRRECMLALEVECKRLDRISDITTSTLAFLDLDKFKFINDHYGHHIGDKALISFTDRIKSTMRENDVVGRYGGDEFLLLLRDTTTEDAENVIQRIFAQPLTVTSEEGDIVPVYCSVGLAQWQPEMDGVQDWIEHADRQMYKTKKSKKQP